MEGTAAMKVIFPVRKVVIYQSEDGVKIEEHKKDFEILRDIDMKREDIDIRKEDIIYLGVIVIKSPHGAQEIKFPIEAKNIKEAFNLFPEYLDKVIKEIQNAQSSIITASEADLDMFSDGDEGPQDSPGIIQL